MTHPTITKRLKMGMDPQAVKKAFELTDAQLNTALKDAGLKPVAKKKAVKKTKG